MQEQQGDNANRLITRLREGYEEKKDLLIYEQGKYILAKDCADGWRKVNSFMLQAGLLTGYRYGNRNIVPRVTLCIEKWENLIPLSFFGYRETLRMNRLERNYLNEDSLQKCRAIMAARNLSKPYSAGIVFGTGRKKSPPCMVGGTLYWAPGRLLADFYLRASEVTKTLAADLHFLDRVLRGSGDRQGAVPPEMAENLGPVKIHLNMAYLLSQWFPLFDLISPGYPLNIYDHKFHRQCLQAIEKARDETYESKWKPERRIINFYRKRISYFSTDKQGRVLSGPSFFPYPKKHVPES